jgi:hypothetical protein
VAKLGNPETACWLLVRLQYIKRAAGARLSRGFRPALLFGAGPV